MDEWVPHDMNKNHKRNRFEISYAPLYRNQNDPFLNRIITCDENWIVYDNRKCSAQWLDADKAAILQFLIQTDLLNKCTCIDFYL